MTGAAKAFFAAPREEGATQRPPKPPPPNSAVAYSNHSCINKIAVAAGPSTKPSRSVATRRLRRIRWSGTPTKNAFVGSREPPTTHEPNMNARPRQTETSTELTPRERYQNTLAVVEYQTPGLDAPLLQEGIGSV